MKNHRPKRKLRIVLRWILWAFLLQFVLLNVSAALYAYKLTHLHTVTEEIKQPLSKNIFAKTWRLFTGPSFYKNALTDTPSFSFSRVILKTKKEIQIEGWYSKTDSVSKGTVILFHGLTGNKGMVLDEATAFRNTGYNIMMIDMRGHGHSGGAVTSMGYKETEEIKMAFDYIAGLGEKNIFLWGSSLGAVEVVKAVSEYKLQPSGIIIEMPFLSLQTHLKWRGRSLNFPEEPFAFLTSFWIGVENGYNGWGLKTSKYAKDVHCPVLMQYGPKDELVKQYETDAIFNAIASANKKLVIYENAGHESLLRNDPVTWKKEVESFLKGPAKTIF